MMARGHSTSTLCAAAIVATVGSALDLVVPTDPKIILLGMVLVMAGSLKPDIDHPTSTATHCWGLLTILECWLWRVLARGYYSRTRLDHEPEDVDPHRHLTHTPFPGAIALGAWEALWLSGAPAWGLWVTLAPFFPQIGAQGALWAHLGTALAVGMSTGLALAPWAHRWRWAALGAGGALGWFLVITPGLLVFVVVCVWFGAVCHSVGDCVTEGGAPLKHPMIVSRESAKTSGRKGARYVTVTTHTSRWAMVGPPRWLRFPTGGWREKGFLVLCVCVTVWVMLGVFGGVWITPPSPAG